MAFTDAINNAMDRWFDADFADPVTLNGLSVNAHVDDQGRDGDENSVFDYIDVEFSQADYSVVNYRADTLVFNGVTYRYPRVLRIDGSYTITVRFIDNQRPKHGRGR